MEGQRSASPLEVLSLGLIVTAFAFVLYATSILIVDHAQKRIYFGADQSEYIKDVGERGIDVERHKRPLFGLLVTPPYRVLAKMGFSHRSIIVLLFWSTGVVAVGLMFFVLQWLFCQPVLAAIIAACYALAFGNVVIFQMPEAPSICVC